jgi:hypothetical protein
LHNAGKYFSSIVVIFMSLGRGHGAGMWWVWLIATLWSTAYSYFWDMWFDWGLWRNTTWHRPSQHTKVIVGV